MSSSTDHSLAAITTDVVVAYAANNHLPAAGLPHLIETVHRAFAALATPSMPATPPADLPTPARIRRSITPDGLISFIDGKSYKTLKRHLTKHGLNPHAYRERYGLPKDYPMVAEAYSERRSDLAKMHRLGVPPHRDRR
ncbi:MucR family transcriptional regulator [Methylobacterium oxalidis]|uniref:MucR family transcriptional regulator n=1 Tax=Methylobacterium oxalidis TaxID=944322 RepID=A0A512IYY3_9HYPH|nr:MucR family transcriptional regulator [Methylobacterium oxalidis]GEP02895.1 hypothetical protein MOX02_09330 [Methylobacterium oxalidis]GJE30316.1 Transcriptional regulatory protein ros [Methylobacterium oxalidis]GLS65828.1 hypothetical protein GCM10007888_42100 [Methylobacterium oxalidis]